MLIPFPQDSQPDKQPDSQPETQSANPPDVCPTCGDWLWSTDDGSETAPKPGFWCDFCGTFWTDAALDEAYKQPRYPHSNI